MSGKKNKLVRKQNRQHTLFWGSSYDRGLDNLLFMWPDIKEKYPDATLYITYGWDLFDTLRGGNPERLQWKENVVKMMSQPGIIHLGRVGKEKLKEIRQKCGIWAYPTYFPEINCITALECQQDGVVPVTMDDFALSETAKEGVLIKGKIEKLEVQEEFKKQLIQLMGDTKRWQELSRKGQEFAKRYEWQTIAPQWEEFFKKPANQPLVSVITISIRTGWWNIMARNLSKQTYSNFEWIIVDDYKEDRSEIAKKYAEKYGLNVRYLRGSAKVSSRRYGLVQANNIGWKEARGELLVYLQDFILIPSVGLELLVDTYRHHPNALIAPVDQYWFAKEPDKTNKEDWWNGNFDVVDRFSWRNVRLQYIGLRPTDNPLDFEMNYGAIPKHILDDLNGWWEWFDDGLGYDNTEIAYRALKKGYEILIDDRNEATCLNLWPIIGGTDENIPKRERYLSTPYYNYLVTQIEAKKLPVVRDEKLDKSIKLEFEVPNEIEDKDCAKWIREHTKEIVEGWLK